MKNAAVVYAKALSEVLSTDLSHEEIEKRIDTFVVILREKGLLHLGDTVIERFSEFFNAREGIVQAEVTVAHGETLDAKAVRAALEKRLNKVVELSVKEDASVLGGVRLHLGDHLYDNTIRNRLSQLRAQLTV